MNLGFITYPGYGIPIKDLDTYHALIFAITSYE